MPYLLSKGSDYARILLANPGEKTHIQSLISEWNIVDSRLTIEDVAFSTEKNRLAAKGWIDINSDSLNLIVAALNKKGCSIMNQELFGSLNNPELESYRWWNP